MRSWRADRKSKGSQRHAKGDRVKVILGELLGTKAYPALNGGGEYMVSWSLVSGSKEVGQSEETLGCGEGKKESLRAERGEGYSKGTCKGNVVQKKVD